MDKVEISVINEGRSGILGIGSEEARISVKYSPCSQDKNLETIETAREVLEKLLAMMGFQADVNVIAPEQEQDIDGESASITLNIEGPDLGDLIGRKGSTIEALQYLVRLITTRLTKTRTPIMIDVQSYRQRRFDSLRTLALNVALQVKNTKSSCRLEPMSPFERRIVHMALADDPDVITESTGEGESRKVIVMPKRKNSLA